MSTLAIRRASRNLPAKGQLELFPQVEQDSAYDRERWLPVPLPDWDDYEVSDMGRVRSWRVRGHTTRRSSMPHLRRPTKAGKGYFSVSGRTGVKPKYVHRLVLFAFVGPCPEGMECRHLDGNRTNNRLSNLKWGTPEENTQDKIEHGTLTPYEPPKPGEPFECVDNFIPIEAIIPAEIWRGIPGFPKYDISNWGRLRSRHSSKRKKFGTPYVLRDPTVDSKGYQPVALYNCESKKYTILHRLVIEAFSPQPHPTLLCRHLNGDTLDNHIANLRWGTHLENMQDMALHGRSSRGERSYNTSLTDDDVIGIRHRLADGERGCRIAKEFGISQQVVCDIKKRRKWNHLL